jgi:hypothetical protein
LKDKDGRGIREVREVREVRGIRGIRGIREIKGIKGIKGLCCIVSNPSWVASTHDGSDRARLSCGCVLYALVFHENKEKKNEIYCKILKMELSSKIKAMKV